MIRGFLELVEGTYQFKASGTDSAAFWQSAEGGLRFDLRDGVLSHISLANDGGTLQIARWQGRAHLHDGKIEIEKGYAGFSRWSI
jgi:hypothetical protein